MSTRCVIGIEEQDGTVRSIYCHHDGYVDHVGRVLATHYASRERADALISLGDISSLGFTLDPQDRSSVASMLEGTYAYHRDRGEPHNVDVDRDADTYFAGHGKRGDEYRYLLRLNGKWYVSDDDEGVSDLATAIEFETAMNVLAKRHDGLWTEFSNALDMHRVTRAQVVACVRILEPDAAPVAG